MTVRYFNHDAVNLYFRITGSGAGYTFGTVDLGLLAPGTDAYANLDGFGSRAKPAAGAFALGEFEEVITLTLRAYTDAGYTILKWTYERSVTVHWIKSDDPAFTVDFLNNFDDGTVQGWAAAIVDGNPAPTGAEVAVVTDYVLSAPYALRGRVYHSYTGTGTFTYWGRGQTYKQFITPNKSAVFCIADVRISGSGTGAISGVTVYGKQVQARKDTDVLILLGKTPDLVLTEYFPKDKWVRLVFPLPANVTLTVRLYWALTVRFTASGGFTINCFIHLDDFKIISK